MSRKIIIGNWKMNLLREEARKLILDIRVGLGEVKNVDVVVCPPFLYLDLVYSKPPSSIKLGAQNCFWKNRGAFTGEISAIQLKGIGCEYIIVGHSERRQHLKEDDVMISQKLEAVISAGLMPILCVGESKEERDKNLTKTKIDEQIEIALEDLTREQIRKIIIAYEPIWAIGTGVFAKPQDAEGVAKFIRGILEDKYDKETAQSVRILYGGSVTAKNIADFVRQPNIDGALVGGASLRAEEFMRIVRNVANLKAEI